MCRFEKHCTINENGTTVREVLQSVTFMSAETENRNRVLGLFGSSEEVTACESGGSISL